MPKVKTTPRKTKVTSKNIRTTKAAQTKPIMSSSSGSQPVWFWKPEKENGYMSQWFESPWEHEGVTYHTAEMWMMIQKAKLFGDEVSPYHSSSPIRN